MITVNTTNIGNTEHKTEAKTEYVARTIDLKDTDKVTMYLVSMMIQYKDISDSANLEALATRFQPLAKIVEAHWSTNVLPLTRQSLLAALNIPRYSKKERIGIEATFNQCQFVKSGTDRNNAPLYIEALQNAYEHKQANASLANVSKEDKAKYLDLIRDLKLEGKTDIEIAKEVNSRKALEAESIKTGNLISSFMQTAIPLSDIFTNSPKDIQRLTLALYAVNPILPPQSHYWTALTLASAIMGKTLVGLNHGRRYYCNGWLALLAETNRNKSLATLERCLSRCITDNPQDSPLATLADNFTMSSLFSYIGTEIDNKTWKALSDVEKIDKEEKAKKDSSSNKARVILSEEFAYTLDSIRNSGSDGKGETGRLLQLYDNEKSIYALTRTDGYRAIHNRAISIIGYTQGETWNRLFSDWTNLSNGLLGRFAIVDIDEYSLALPEPTRTPQEAEEELYLALRAIFNKVKRVRGRLVTNFGQEQGIDFAGSIIDSIVERNPYFKAFIEGNMFPWELLRGKFIAQAIKYTLVHCFLNMDIDALPKEARKDSPLKEADNPFAEDSNISPLYSDDIQCNLKDKGIFSMYCQLLIANAIKLSNSNKGKTEYDLVMERIYKAMRQKQGPLAVRDIQRMTLKLNGYPLNASQIYEFFDALVAKGIGIIEPSKKGSKMLRATGKVLD